MNPIRVAVVGGGRSSEHDVSLASAAAVRTALDTARYEVVELTIGLDGRWSAGSGPALELRAAVGLIAGCDVAMPMVHGRHGEDGTLAALFDVLGVPYVGSGVGAGAIAMDKWVTKLVATAVGVPVAPGRLLTADTVLDAEPVERPLVVKPVSAGSSHGVTLVRAGEHLGPAVAAALRLDDRVLVEDALVGREIDIAVLGRPDGSRIVSPALEIVCTGIFDHTSKYGGAADFRVPATMSASEHVALRDAALAMFDALGCRGLARVDFFLTADGWVLNEVNTTPGFTPASQVPRMFAAAGVAYPDLVDLLIDDALRLSGAPAATRS